MRDRNALFGAVLALGLLGAPAAAHADGYKLLPDKPSAESDGKHTKVNAPVTALCKDCGGASRPPDLPARANRSKFSTGRTSAISRPTRRRCN